MASQYNFSKGARIALTAAKKIAVKYNTPHAGSESILLGLLHDPESPVIGLLESMDIDIDKMVEVVDDQCSQSTSNYKIEEVGQVSFTPRTTKLLRSADKIREEAGSDLLSETHIFLALLYDKGNGAQGILSSFGIDSDKISEYLDENVLTSGDPPELVGDDGNVVNTGRAKTLTKKKTKEATEIDEMFPYSVHKFLSQFTIDLTKLAFTGEIDKVIGRKDEIERAVRILCRRTKNNPVLIGEPGVGKTAIVEGIAQRIVSRECPTILEKKFVLRLDINAMIAGTKFRGQFEERMKKLIDIVKECKDIILFIDELHTIIGAGSAEGTNDAANILKPALSRAEFQCIGATTFDEYRNIEDDAALERRFQPINVNQPSIEDTILILDGIKKHYEEFHNVEYTDESIVAAVEMANRYIPARFFPDKAIDIIDEVGADKRVSQVIRTELDELKQKVNEAREKKNDLVRKQDFEEAAKFRDIEKEQEEKLTALQKKIEKEKKNAKPIAITKKDVQAIISKMTGIQVLTDTERYEKISKIENQLNAKVISQETAIRRISEAVICAQTDLNDPNKPLGSILLLGPTGVGKTMMSKELNYILFDDYSSMVRIDMSEIHGSHSVTKLIGAGPEYVGYGKGGAMTEKVRRNPYRVVLFDEIDKANPAAIQILLQILEEGEVTDGNGRKISFRNTYVIMTSNTGSQFITEREPTLGFQQVAQKTLKKDRVLDELKQSMRPEFLNRIDSIIVCNALNHDDAKKIAKFAIDDLRVKVEKNYEVKLTVQQNVIDWIVQHSFNEQYGARDIKREIKNKITVPLSKKLFLKDYKKGAKITCKLVDNEIQFK